MSNWPGLSCISSRLPLPFPILSCSLPLILRLFDPETSLSLFILSSPSRWFLLTFTVISCFFSLTLFFFSRYNNLSILEEFNIPEQASFVLSNPYPIILATTT